VRIKLDEALSGALVDSLKRRGHFVATVREQGWGGLNDSLLWPLVAAEKAFFVTADKGFGDIRAFPPGTHAGILLLRPDREGILEYKALLEDVLGKHRLESLAHTVTVATPRRIRIRRKPQAKSERPTP